MPTPLFLWHPPVSAAVGDVSQDGVWSCRERCATWPGMHMCWRTFARQERQRHSMTCFVMWKRPRRPLQITATDSGASVAGGPCSSPAPVPLLPPDCTAGSVGCPPADQYS